MKAFKERRKKGEPINMRKEFQFVSDDLTVATNKGHAKGRDEGEQESRGETVKRMIKLNYTDDQIKGVTEANEAEINAIRAEIKNG